VHSYDQPEAEVVSNIVVYTDQPVNSPYPSAQRLHTETPWGSGGHPYKETQIRCATKNFKRRLQPRACARER